VNYLSDDSIAEFIRTALAEDLGDGDHSSLASIPLHSQGKARLLVKDEGILAGIELSSRIFHFIDSGLSLNYFLHDGAAVHKGMEAFVVEGSVHSILKAERLVLNCMQRMSGIATYTASLNALISHTHAKLLDTRKTTPNFRICEKWAVKIGGGTNHRYGLFDMIMLKDNHIDFAGGITKALEATEHYLNITGKSLNVVIETRTLEEVEEALSYRGKIKRIMLDNMPLETLSKAVQMIKGNCESEASGGVTERTIKAIAETGVDYISVGALTHQVKSLDLSLKAF
jgi:nicotinate-nucleotide pyrophosphorylase (carboxylating)